MTWRMDFELCLTEFGKGRTLSLQDCRYIAKTSDIFCLLGDMDIILGNGIQEYRAVRRKDYELSIPKNCKSLSPEWGFSIFQGMAVEGWAKWN